MDTINSSSGWMQQLSNLEKNDILPDGASELSVVVVVVLGVLVVGPSVDVVVVVGFSK